MSALARLFVWEPYRFRLWVGERWTARAEQSVVRATLAFDEAEFQYNRRAEFPQVYSPSVIAVALAEREAARGRYQLAVSHRDTVKGWTSTVAIRRDARRGR